MAPQKTSGTSRTPASTVHDPLREQWPQIDPQTGERLGLLATWDESDGGWKDNLSRLSCGQVERGSQRR